VIQREHPEIGVPSIGSLFVANWSPPVQINKTRELRINVKTVETSYTSALN